MSSMKAAIKGAGVGVGVGVGGGGGDNQLKLETPVTTSPQQSHQLSMVVCSRCMGVIY